MVQIVFEGKADSDQRFRWIDVVDPSREELEELAKSYDLAPDSVQVSLDSTHLPKVEEIEDDLFVVVRFFDEQASETADTVQALTRKISIYSSHESLITIHRSDPSFLFRLRQKWSQTKEFQPDLSFRIVREILRESFATYKTPLAKASEALDELQDHFFKQKGSREIIQDLFLWQQKISSIKRVVRLSIDNIIPTMGLLCKTELPLDPSLKEESERVYFYADELGDEVSNLLNLNLALSSNRTNETMRLLTVFSVFFMPLNFIVGIYGMNFAYMPELQFRYGYFTVLAVLMLLAVSIYFWFRRNGWF